MRARRRRRARVLPVGLRLDGVEKRRRPLAVSSPRERRCSFRCSTVWVHTSSRRVLSLNDDRAARSRPSANTRPIQRDARLSGVGHVHSEGEANRRGVPFEPCGQRSGENARRLGASARLSVDRRSCPARRDPSGTRPSERFPAWRARRQVDWPRLRKRRFIRALASGCPPA